jgi:hypothetical protein
MLEFLGHKCKVKTKPNPISHGIGPQKSEGLKKINYIVGTISKCRGENLKDLLKL